jgi:transposase
MRPAYSIDFRERAIEYVSECHGDRSEVCRVFNIAASTLQNWITLKKKMGNLSSKRKGSRPWKLDHDAVIKHVETHSDSTLKEIADVFSTGKSAIDYILKKNGITRKKNHAVRRAKRRKAGRISG